MDDWSTIDEIVDIVDWGDGKAASSARLGLAELLGRSRQVQLERLSLALARNTQSRADLSFSIDPKVTWPEWLGARLVYWPHGMLSGRRVGILSSRLGRPLHAKREWFSLLRTACLHLCPNRDLLLTTAGTTADRFVTRCAKLFGRRLLRLHFPRGDTSIVTWLSGVLNSTVESPCGTVYLSPRIETVPSPGNDLAIDRFPIQDRLVSALSDWLLVLSVRRGGNTHQLVLHRLDDCDLPAGRVHVACGTDLICTPVVNDLLDRGAIGWYVMGRDEQSQRNGISELTTPRDKYVVSDHVDGTVSAVADIVPLNCVAQEDYLLHWTRTQEGPWPDQSEDNYLDELILGVPCADHSALATLARIVVEKRIVASNRTVRGEQPVVSFTARQLSELSTLRVYRPHLRRWDFEPYGIAIRRNRLKALGAQPVMYGDESTWRQLSETERSYFQVVQTTKQFGRQPIDWTEEQEWRHIGDVDMSGFADREVLVFVPTIKEANHVARLSLWPTVVIE